eukprot:366229-Chlamydomonas_euryale.AAC.16
MVMLAAGTADAWSNALTVYNKRVHACLSHILHEIPSAPGSTAQHSDVAAWKVSKPPEGFERIHAVCVRPA